MLVPMPVSWAVSIAPPDWTADGPVRVGVRVRVSVGIMVKVRLRFRDRGLREVVGLGLELKICFLHLQRA